MNYTLEIPKDDAGRKLFVCHTLFSKLSLKDGKIIRANSILKTNLLRFQTILLNNFDVVSKVYGPWTNGYGSKYYVLQVQKKSEVNKAFELITNNKKLEGTEVFQ